LELISGGCFAGAVVRFSGEIFRWPSLLLNGNHQGKIILPLAFYIWFLDMGFALIIFGLI
jgi:hypothetical protein